MKLHRNAKSTPSSRLLLVRRVLFEGWSYPAAAEGAGVSERTVAKWVRRFREAGIAGLEDGVVPARRAGAPDAALGGDADSVAARTAWPAGVGDWPRAADPTLDRHGVAPTTRPESAARGAAPCRSSATNGRARAT